MLGFSWIYLPALEVFSANSVNTHRFPVIHSTKTSDSVFHHLSMTKGHYTERNYPLSSSMDSPQLSCGLAGIQNVMLPFLRLLANLNL